MGPPQKNLASCLMRIKKRKKFMHIFSFLFSEHFPYFKTAPTGWKNSVRHNLSLNKCFEKIEKPATNGTNQRKGCLWAMNPAKIVKMEEEVAKWSRKDPMAIKKGMSHPGNFVHFSKSKCAVKFVFYCRHSRVS